ncbi:Pycsar system effector family protein [Streptomyces sp. NPDC059835]|uniref:Pycsar system effector family protein n=1 Tax=Streptomyces sp. NPDC059835 TaxID=3346967 RepID=UPI00365F659B
MTTSHARHATLHESAEVLRAEAGQALAGADSEPVCEPPTGGEVGRATAYATLACATQVADLSNRLLHLGQDVRRIADTFRSDAEPPEDYTETELHVVRTEITRADTKASILLASVAIVAGLLAQKAAALMHNPWPIATLGVLATCLAAVATWILLDVVLPRLAGPANTSFLHYADATPTELDAALGQMADRRGELAILSRIARIKFRHLARAGALLKISGVLFAAIAMLAAAF